MKHFVTITSSLLCLLSACTSVKVDKQHQADQLASQRHEDTLKIAARPAYDKGFVHRMFFGKYYRDIWSTPVTVDTLSIAQREYTILKQGGGRQTLNIRVQDPKGNLYVLRSIDKNPASRFSPEKQQSGLARLVKDQASAGYPYGSLTTPAMSEVLGIYHVNPKLYVIGDDPALGEYHDDFAGMMVTLEHYPDEDQSEFACMGHSKKIVSTETMLKDMFRQNNSKIDQQLYLKSRLFDMIIGDFSRHEDNWRWASYPTDSGSFYKPIPRDRDNTFFYIDGFVPWIFQRIYPQHTSFKKNLKTHKGLNRSGGNLDNYILLMASQEDWVATADTVKQQLSDEVIDEALRDMPPEVYEKNGEWLAERLQSRRDALPDQIVKYYRQLIREPKIYGSAQSEKFVLTAIGKQVQVEVFKIGSKAPDQLLFKRTFDPSETKEISVLGLDGNDIFEFKGTGKSKIKLLVYGGAGEDEYVQEANKKLMKATIIESENGGNEYDLKKGIKQELETELAVSQFDVNGALLEFYLWD